MSRIKKGNIWFSADQHFEHENIIRYNNRPFHSVQEMTRALMASHLETVRAFDTVYWLGDLLFMGAKIPHFAKTHTHTVLIRGNHDKATAEEYQKAGIREVANSLEIEYEGEKITLVHNPVPLLAEEAKRQGVEVTGMMWDNPIVQILAESLPTKVFCGHVHTLFKHYGQLVNVGVDVWDYRPVSIQEVLSAYKEPSILSETRHRREL